MVITKETIVDADNTIKPMTCRGIYYFMFLKYIFLNSRKHMLYMYHANIHLLQQMYVHALLPLLCLVLQTK